MDESDIPTFAELAADPDIAPLLDFTPVPRQLQKANGWNAAMQRMFIAWLAHYGSPGKAAAELGKARSGIDKVYKDPAADSFRAAWDGAVALAEQRVIDRLVAAPTGAGAMKPPSISDRRKTPPLDGEGQGWGGPGQPNQVRNEFGEWEEERSYHHRAEGAEDSIATKLLRIRRLYLQEIAASPGKRAAFEILTELPVDWAAAERGDAQPDEPYRTANQRHPDMILLAESGWSFGECGYGPDRKQMLRDAIDERRAEQGLPAISWGEPGDD